MIEEKIDIIKNDTDLSLGSEKDVDEISKTNDQDMIWIYLTHCLKSLVEIKEMLIHAGVPLLHTGMNLDFKAMKWSYYCIIKVIL